MKNKRKKFGKILSAITLTNVLVAFFALTVSLSTTVFADEPATPAPDPAAAAIAQLNTALDIQHDPKNHCITDTDRAAGWIISFIEEPLSLDEDVTSTKLQTRLCYRSTLRFMINGEEKTITELSKKIPGTETGCSQTAENIANDAQMVATYKVSYNCRAIMAVLGKGGASYIEGYVGLIYRWAAGLVGLIATAVIIISSIQISFSGGEAEEINKAKGRILKSLAGIAVLFLSGLILYTVNPTFFTR